MKVCLVTTAFPRWEGDTRGVFVYEAVQAIHRQGVEVKVIAMHNPGAKRREMMAGIEVLRPQYLPETWENLQKTSAGLPQAWKENPSTRLTILPFLLVHTLACGIHARDCDLIHANWTLSAAAAWASRLLHRKPYVVTVQGSDIFQAARSPMFRKLTALALKGSGRVMALSRALEEETRRLGIPPEQIAVVPNGVDVAHFSVPDNRLRQPVILYVGSLIERKGVNTLIEAFQRIAPSHADYSLVVVGEGPQRAALEDLARKYPGLKVVFTGPLSQEDVRKWMQLARVLVLPSIEEGQGVVLVEALACGTPCVGSDVGGIPDVIVPDVGRLVPPKNPQALGDAIAEVIDHPEQWEAMSRQSRLRAENSYHWDKIATGIISIYNQELFRGKEKRYA